MRVVIAGAHGQIARRLGRLLSSRGDTVAGIVRNPDHRADLESDGVQPVVLDLEQASLDDVAAVVSGADAVVFAAGGGPNSGIARKDTVDRGAAVLLADAAATTGVRPYLLVSSIGVEQVAGGSTPEGMDEVFVAYLQAKLAAEEYVLSREGLAPMVIRPGGLTDDPGTGRVRLEHITERGTVPRDDVAAVLLELLTTRRTASWPSCSPATPPSPRPWPPFPRCAWPG
jgi:nucleoside-diphosphate-sugar epimerase